MIAHQDNPEITTVWSYPGIKEATAPTRIAEHRAHTRNNPKFKV